MLPIHSSPAFQDYICCNQEDIPVEALAVINPEIMNQLGKSVSAMFPAFCAAFPLTAWSIDAYWPHQLKFFITMSVVDRYPTYQVVLEREDLNLFFNSPLRIGYETEGEFFYKYRAMLPTKWIELYRWFDSFCIIENAKGGHVTKNTPFDYVSRLDLEDFRQEYELKKADIQDFSKAIDSKQLRCWMVTDGGNSLWLDEQRCDHKVYHVKSGDFKNFYVLPDPEATLDKYLAHYVAGGQPESFDFRAH